MVIQRARGKLILLLVCLLMVPALAARAAEISTTCADLQAALNAANDGDVITITDPVCTGTSYTMKTGTEITLQGAAGTGTTFNGGTPPTTRILSGLDIKGSIFRNLTFSNGNSNLDGGGVAVTGTVYPTFNSVSFIDNQGRQGGGLWIDSSATSGTIRIVNSTFEGNRADDSGGGLAIDALDGVELVVLESNTFTDNTAREWGGGLFTVTGDLRVQTNTLTDNQAGYAGGGAYVVVDQVNAEIFGNTFTSNSVVPVTTIGSGYYGGGLYLGINGGGNVAQIGNEFNGNDIDAPSGGSVEGYGGAGEFVARANLSESIEAADIFTWNDQFINNVANDPGAGVEVDGGGFGGRHIRVAGWNTVAAGNRVLGGDAEGAGMYIGAMVGTTMSLVNATVSGNTAVTGTPGIGGNSGDTLNLHNSIVAGNTGTTPDIFGFGTLDVQYSDSCIGIGFLGGPFPGPGNICADPLLVGPGPGSADVHQTSASPTIDRGSNALLPSSLTDDYEGDERILDGNGDAVWIVDMGADEFRPATIPRPQQPPQQQPPAAQPPATPLLQTAAARRGRIPATGPEDLLPQTLAGLAYLLIGVLFLRMTSHKWHPAWKATSYVGRHRVTGSYVGRHRVIKR